MDFIDGSFVNLSNILIEKLAPGVFTDLLTEGIIPGLGGIAILFLKLHFYFFFYQSLRRRVT